MSDILICIDVSDSLNALDPLWTIEHSQKSRPIFYLQFYMPCDAKNN